MSSITAKLDPERTNRWLLIGALVLAVFAGVLIFAALASGGGDDDKASANIAAGDNDVLVAKDKITEGSQITAEMFRVAKFNEDDLVANHISNIDAYIGQTVTTDILKGQQLSRENIASTTDDPRADQLAFKVDSGMRAIGVAVNDVSTFGGLVVPGDHVDVVVTYDEKDSNAENAQKWRRISTVLQNVTVKAREQVEVQRVNPVDGNGTTDDGSTDEGEPPIVNSDEFNQRPEDFDPDGGVSVVTLQLTPQDIQALVLADSLGEVTLVLRKFGDDTITPIEDVRVPVYD
ncbi:MAG TPA: Flp pilus assembly protein CpaB [Dehalococcoidia bacterium]|nr:Flp pilus assembly protein CpaB [Dehalococcoidia bacterium]